MGASSIVVRVFAAISALRRHFAFQTSGPHRALPLITASMLAISGCASAGNQEAALCAAPAEAAALVDADAAMSAAKAGNTGEQPGPGLAGEPFLLWRFDGENMSAPLVEEGTVYVTTGGAFYALNALSGQEQWRQSLTEGVQHPVTSGGSLYAGKAGYLYSVRIDDGEIRWKAKVGAPMESPPVIVGNTVYAATGAPHNTAGLVTALDIATGEQRWTFAIPDKFDEFPNAVSFDAGLSLNGQGVYFGTGAGVVYGLDLDTGQKCWDFGSKSGNFIFQPVVVTDGSVFFVGEQNLNALDAETGERKWQYGKVSGLSGIVVVHGLAYVSDDAGSIHAVGARSGERRWTFETGDFRSMEPVVAEEVLYAASDDGFLYAVDAATGTQIWRYQVGKVCSRPAVVNGVLYVSTADGLLAIAGSVS